MAKRLGRWLAAALVLAVGGAGLLACGGSGGGGDDGGDTTPPVVSASPLGGTYGTDQNVELSANETADIYYTINDTAPTTASALYAAPIPISVTTTLRFLGVDTAGNASAAAAQIYIIDKVAPTVSANPAGGSHSGTQNVVLSATDASATTIYYTVGGGEPTTASTEYAAAIQVAVDTVIKFFALDAAGNASAVVTETYTIMAPAARTLKTVSGSVETTAAAAAKAAVADGALVEVRSYDAAGALIGSANANTNAAGFYTVQLDLADAGGYLTVRVRKEGFTDTTKRINFAAAQNVTANAALQAVVTVVAPLGTALKASGESVSGFSLGVVRYGDGTRVALGSASELAAAKAADAVTELQIDVPATSVPLETETLTGKLRSFDPTDAADARNFPGDYVDADGNRLVSVAFDFMEIADEDGTSLGDLVRAARLAGAAVEPTRVQRWIPTGSCQSLSLGDKCTGGVDDLAECADLDSADGFQVPVYTLDRVAGVWNLLGVGSVVDATGTQVVDVSVANCSPAGSSIYYLDILVTNENFLRSWWNLDYPLVFDEPVQVCIEKTFLTLAGAPVESVQANLRDDDSASSFGYAYGYSNALGKVTLAALITDGNTTVETADLTATLSHYDPFTYQWNEEVVTLGVLGDDGVCPATLTNTLTPIALCEVQATVVDDQGAPVANRYVWFYPTDGSYFRAWTYSDALGEVVAEVPCDRQLRAYLGSDWTPEAEFEVDGAVTEDEASDDGDVVVLKDLAPANGLPNASGWLASYSIREGRSTQANLYASDSDGDYPLAFTLTTGSQTLASGSYTASQYEKVVTVAGLTAGTYPLTFTVTDTRGGERAVSLGSLSVTAAGVNRPPYVTAYPETYKVTEAGQTIEFYSYAYDPDGDYPLTFAWSIDGGEVVGIGESYTFTVPQNAEEGDSFEVELSVSDGMGGTATAGFTLFFGAPAQVDVIVQ